MVVVGGSAMLTVLVLALAYQSADDLSKLERMLDRYGIAVAVLVVGGAIGWRITEELLSIHKAHMRRQDESVDAIAETQRDIAKLAQRQHDLMLAQATVTDEVRRMVAQQLKGGEMVAYWTDILQGHARDLGDVRRDVQTVIDLLQQHRRSD